MVVERDNIRQVRVSGAIRDELARLLVSETNDPELAWVTISGVKVSKDLKHARVFFVETRTSDSSLVAKRLNRAKPFLKRELGRSLKLRHTPDLAFIYDDSFEQGEHIDQLIRQVNTEKSMLQKDASEAKVLASLVDKAELILIATHRNPDGDAIGALLAMHGILTLLNKTHVTYCPDGIPKVLSFLPGKEGVTDKLNSQMSFDLTIVLDTADESLLPDGFPQPEKRGTFFVIDHHMRYKEMGDHIIRREASAVGEILYDITKELVWPLDAGIAQCLYTSIVADTGSFRYSSTTPSTHHAAADLVAAGAQPWVVATWLYESYPVRRQRLLGKVLETLRVSEDGRFAHMSSTPEMIEAAGALREDMDGMINFGRSIEGVEISAMFRVNSNGDIKVSFRSRGRVDVSSLAANFKGGGHHNAAGCTISGMELVEAQKTIETAATALLAECDTEDPNNT